MTVDPKNLVSIPREEALTFTKGEKSADQLVVNDTVSTPVDIENLVPYDPKAERDMGEIRAFEKSTQSRFLQKGLETIGLAKTPEEKKARSANVYAMSEMTGLSFEEVEKNYDTLRRMEDLTGIQSSMEASDVVKGALVALIAAKVIPAVAGAATLGAAGLAIGKTALGMAGYKLLGKVIDLQGFARNNLTNYDYYADPVKGAIGFADFALKIAIMREVYTKAPKLYDAVTKSKMVDYRLPETVYVSAKQIKDMHNSVDPKLTTEFERDILKSSNISSAELSRAIKTGEGIRLKVPSSALITMADKPYWARVKGFFGRDAFYKSYREYAGQPQEDYLLLPGKTDVFIGDQAMIGGLNVNVDATFGKTSSVSVDGKSFIVPTDKIHSIDSTLNKDVQIQSGVSYILHEVDNLVKKVREIPVDKSAEEAVVSKGVSRNDDNFLDKLIAENDKLQVGDQIFEDGELQGTVIEVTKTGVKGKKLILVEGATSGGIISGKVNELSMLEGEDIKVVRPAQSKGKVEGGDVTKMKLGQIDTSREWDMPDEYNDTVNSMVKNLREGKELPPIEVTKDGRLVNGRHRLTAYKRFKTIGTDNFEVPVKIVADKAHGKVEGGVEAPLTAEEILPTKTIEVTPDPEPVIVDKLIKRIEKIKDYTGLTDADAKSLGYDDLPALITDVVKDAFAKRKDALTMVKSLAENAKGTPDPNPGKALKDYPEFTVSPKGFPEKREQPTIREKPALKIKLQAASRASKLADRIARKELKEKYSLIRKIKTADIQDMNYKEREGILALQQKLKMTKTLEGLRELYLEIAELKEIGKAIFSKNKEAKDMLLSIKEELLAKTIRKAAKKTPPPDNAVITGYPRPNMDTQTTNAYLRPQRMFDRLGGGGATFDNPVFNIVYRSLNRAMERETLLHQHRTDKLKAGRDALGVSLSQLSSKQMIDGQEFTVDQMISVYALAKNKTQMMALVYGNNMPVKMINGIIDRLTPEQKQFGDMILDDLASIFPYIRDTLLEYTDYKFTIEQISGYFMLKRMFKNQLSTEEELVEDLMGHSNFHKLMVEHKFTMDRKDIPKEFQTPVRLGALELWTSESKKQEHFIAMGNLVKDLHTLFNRESIRSAIVDGFGIEYSDWVKGYLNRMANPNFYKAATAAEKTIGFFRRSASVAHLTYGLVSVMPKQAASYFIGIADIPPVHTLSALYDLIFNYDETSAMIDELAPQVKHRNIERELEEWRVTDPKNIEPLRQKIAQIGFTPIYVIDRFTVQNVWLAKFKELTSKGYSDLEAAEMSTENFLRSQPAAHAKDLPEAYASGEAFNVMLQYTNQLNQNWNIMTYDIPELAKTKEDGKPGDWAKATRLAVGLALGAITIYTITNRRLPTNVAEIIDALTSGTLSTIPLLGRVAARTYEDKTYGRESIPALSGFVAGIDSANAIRKGDYNKAMTEALRSAATIGGWPFGGPEQIIKLFQPKPAGKAI